MNHHPAITSADGTPLYRYSIHLDNYVHVSDHPDHSPHLVTFTLYHHENDLYEPQDCEILPAILEVVKEALEAFPDALAAALAATAKLRAELRGFSPHPPPQPAT